MCIHTILNQEWLDALGPLAGIKPAPCDSSAVCTLTINQPVAES